ncbi:HAD family hydrolase [Agathobaculum sp.]|uniref:HAD family hydrolase n=1 Tax=Agathobaculum sp. TaxID=2048138 RepID=UPI002A7EE82F|nr:HAD family hydrolase [Agathobaculum sp.]MDY3617666.1 HAD family hydrolase [Agathobaculum sp.]
MKQLFACDYDGTLSQDGGIDEETLRAIRDYQARGGLFGICSGRDPGSLQSELSAYDLTCDFFIMMNGSRIECGGDCVREHVLTGFEQALPLLSESCLFFSMTGDGELCLCPPDFRLEEPAEQAYMDDLRTKYRQVSRPEDMRVVYQISCRTPGQAEAVALAEKLHTLGLDAFPNWEYVDIVPHGVSKAEAVAFVGSRYGVDDQNIYTAGDGRNDMEMLRRFGGFAIEYAEDCVRQAAGRTVRTVGQALRQLLE